MPARVPVAKAAVGAVLVLIGGIAATDLWQVVVIVVVVAAALVWAVRDVLAPVRVAADPDGVTLVTGFVRRTTVPWHRVDRIRVDERRRSRMLEIDTDAKLHLVSRYEVDIDLDEVARQLESLRAAAR